MDIDEDKLLPVLDSLTADLNVPFLERRGRSNLHRRSPVGAKQLEELTDVVNLLNQRERELTAAVDIAKMLVAKSKRHLSSLEEAKDQTEMVTRVLRAHQQEILLLREALLTAEEKNAKTAALLVEAEDNLSKLSHESAVKSEHLKNLQRQSGPTGEEVLIAELKETMAEQYQAFDSNAEVETRRMLERENEKLRDSAISLERDILSLHEEIRKLRGELSLCSKKLGDSTRLVRSLETRIHDLEEEAKNKDLDLSVTLKKVEKLTEELSAGSPSPNGDWRKSRPSVNRSTVFSLQECGSEGEESEVSDEEFTRIEGPATLSPGGKSGEKHFVFDCWQSALTIDPQPSLSLPPSIHRDPDSGRKDPGEEYFALVPSTQASQAVKLNSPYMDAICTVPIKELYEKAVKNAIPFHKVRTR